jgi:predicted ATPase
LINEPAARGSVALTAPRFPPVTSRAATSLARLCRNRGRRAEARNLLAPVYGWFTEGVETADLKDAKALLGELV